MKHLVTLAALCVASSVHAAPMVFSASAGGGAQAGTTLWNLDSGSSLPSGIASLVLQPDAAFVTGARSGIYAPPFLSGQNGVGFGAAGGNQANGVDRTLYLTTGSTGAMPGASITLTFANTMQHFGLLWGSVDAYNSMSFFNNGSLLGTITGSDVLTPANGNQGVNGTAYVSINSTPFDTIVFTSSQYAFEFDNISWSRSTVPVPGVQALMGIGIAGMLAKRRRASNCK